MYIRPATPEDLELCEGLDHTYTTRRVWQVTVEHRRTPALEETELLVQIQPSRLPRPLVVTLPPLETPLRLAAERYDSFAVLVASDETVCGYAAVHAQPGRPVAELSLLHVAPQFRRQGGGTLLLKWAHRWARNCGLDGLLAHAPNRADPAICFYRRNGFRACGYSDHFYANQDIALFFVRE